MNWLSDTASTSRTTPVQQRGEAAGRPARSVPAATTQEDPSPRKEAPTAQAVLPDTLRRMDGKGEASMILKTKSALMASVLGAAKAAAQRSASPILLMGESGTGKTTLASQIHEWTGRSGAFVRVNCTNINSNIGEAELFGHVARAFTGAGEAKRGAVEAADKGTLFLDEIGELSLELQAKLLDLVESGTFHAVGGHQVKRVDVRIVTATHRNLDEMVAAGTFRQDLYFRLGKLRVEMPSLRDRREDMLDLIADLCARGGWEIPADVVDVLGFGSYPGNIRQLDGVLEAAHVGQWDAERAKAEVAKMGTASVRPKPVASSPRLLSEDRLSVARELSASRASTGGWWTAAELAAAAGVARRTASADATRWVAMGEVFKRGSKTTVQYCADLSNCSSVLKSAQGHESGLGGEP